MNVSGLYKVSLLVLALTSAAVAQTPSPSARGVHDPVMIKQGDYYYLFFTGRGIEIRRSRNLYDWEPAGRVFERLPDWLTQAVPGVRGLWAPDISFRDGRYFVYYSGSTFGKNLSCIGLASNGTLDPGDPNYLWVDEGKVIGSTRGDDYNAIDANVFEDGEGQWWLVFGSFWSGIKLTALDGKRGKPLTDPPVLTAVAGRPMANGAIEAPFVIRRGEWYYLFVSFDICCRGVNSTYNIRVGRAKSPSGPYMDQAGVLMTRGGGTLVLEGNDQWKGPGHNGILSEGGTDYLVYHAYEVANRGRSALRIRPLIWSEEGWPSAREAVEAPMGSK